MEKWKLLKVSPIYAYVQPSSTDVNVWWWLVFDSRSRACTVSGWMMESIVCRATRSET